MSNEPEEELDLLQEGDVKVVKTRDVEVIITQMVDGTHVGVYFGEQLAHEKTFFSPEEEDDE